MSYYLQKSIVHLLPRGTQRALKILIVLAVAALFCFLIGFFASSFTPIAHIEVSDTLGMSRADFLTVAGVQNQSYWAFNADKVRQNIKAIPEVKDADVVRRFPKKLEITVEKRVPVAMFITKVDQKNTLSFIDDEGFVFGNAAAPDVAVPMPIISDPSMNVQPGFQISPQILKLLAELRVLDADVISAISEVEVNWKRNGTYNYNAYDLILYMVHSPVRVRMNLGLNNEDIKTALLTLDSLKKEKVVTQELDCRSTMLSFVPEYSKGGLF
jgi:cell division protein FtsQ